jgi:hypothetical protein
MMDLMLTAEPAETERVSRVALELLADCLSAVIICNMIELLTQSAKAQQSKQKR